MAAVSAPQAPSALTPPSSSHGGPASWNYSVPAHSETTSQSKPSENRTPLASSTNGHALGHQTSRPDLSQRRTDTFNSTRSADSGMLAPARVTALNRKDSTISETGSAADSLLDLYGPNRSGISSIDYGDRKNGENYNNDEDPDHSRWIHRDKLARIESRELQAAGIILPRSRAPSKSSRRDHSRDQQGNGVRSEQATKRQRIESFPTEEEEAPESNSWDLRLPDEVADGGFKDVSGGVKGVSKIPVFKTSPLPIPLEHLARDTPMKWKEGGVWTGDEDAITYPKSRSRANSTKDTLAATSTPAKRLASDNSPTKKAVKKAAPGIRTASAPQRPKARSGSNAQRPPTRGQGAELNKRPEGDPPWLASMYKPDPRLPPDQQLLPTVAKRLQQEQWEKEGKFGNMYDTAFRPLNDEVPDAPVAQTAEDKGDDEHGAEWPLRTPRSPTLSTGRPGTAGGQGSYSTMPKIPTGAPQGVNLPSPKPVKVPEPVEEKSSGGCGCCVVM